jgi:hypothetical protein
MSKEVVSPLRQRMIEDMNARKLGAHSQRSHIHSCRRLAAFLKRSPDTATPDDIRISVSNGPVRPTGVSGARSTDERTLISNAIPAVGSGDKFLLIP